MPLLPFWVLRLLDGNYKDSSFLLSDTRIGIEIILYLNKDRGGTDYRYRPFHIIYFALSVFYYIFATL